MRDHRGLGQSSVLGTCWWYEQGTYRTQHFECRAPSYRFDINDHLFPLTTLLSNSHLDNIDLLVIYMGIYACI